MEELIARIAAATGLQPDVIQKAVGLILEFLQKEGPQAEVGQLIASLPGAHQAIQTAETQTSGGGGLMGILGGMMGGDGVMALGTKLMSNGVGMSQMQPLGQELFNYAREKIGEDQVGEIVAAVPGLSQFV